MGVQKYLPKCSKLAIYFFFLVPKITAIVCAMPTKARPTPSAWNHEHDGLSDFVPIASLFGGSNSPNSEEEQSILPPF